MRPTHLYGLIKNMNVFHTLKANIMWPIYGLKVYTSLELKTSSETNQDNFALKRKSLSIKVVIASMIISLLTNLCHKLILVDSNSSLMLKLSGS